LHGAADGFAAGAFRQSGNSGDQAGKRGAERDPDIADGLHRCARHMFLGLRHDGDNALNDRIVDGAETEPG